MESIAWLNLIRMVISHWKGNSGDTLHVTLSETASKALGTSIFLKWGFIHQPYIGMVSDKKKSIQI